MFINNSEDEEMDVCKSNHQLPARKILSANNHTYEIEPGWRPHQKIHSSTTNMQMSQSSGKIVNIVPPDCNVSKQEEISNLS